MSETCKECQLSAHPNNTCLQALRLLSQQLELKLQIQHQKLEYYEANSKSLINIPYPIDSYKHLIHEHVCCDGCYEMPLKGTRYKCKQCPNFDLCNNCRIQIPHYHSEFFPITTPVFHKEKVCSTCFAMIADVIHKCTVCGIELCHECKIVNGHDHDEIIDILPFEIKVEAYCNKKNKKCKNGDEIMIQFFVYNLTQQVINSLIVIEEDCPFQVIKREMKLNLQEKGIAVVEIGGIIKAQPRLYNTKFTFKQEIFNQVIGPEIIIKFQVSEGLFSTLFKG